MTSLLPADYQTRSADEKLRLLWAPIAASEWTDEELPSIGVGAFYAEATMKGLFAPWFLRRSLEHISDEMPEGRDRIIHKFGSCAQIEYESTGDHPYTGVFATGATGLTRLSMAKPDAFTPGLSFKFLIDGRPSVNIMSLPSLDGGSDDQNFFGYVGTTVIPPPKGFLLQFLRMAFQATTKLVGGDGLRWNALPVQHIARVTRDGQDVADARWPAELVFEPVPETQTSSDPTPNYRVKLRAIQPGSTLYKVYAREVEGSDDMTPIGRIVARSKLVASRYGDETIYFQHDRGKPLDK